MTRIIAYDLCRLFIGPNFLTPRGIDRVDLALASHIFSDPQTPHMGVLPTPMGVRAYPASVTRQLLEHLQNVWNENPDTDGDPKLQWLIKDMTASSPHEEQSVHSGAAGLTRLHGAWRHIKMLRQIGIKIGENAARSIPKDAIYMNIGQIGLAVPSFFEWLTQRPDITCAMMVHDTIPLDHPELVKPSSVENHARMLQTAARHADCFLFGTAFAKACVDEVVKQKHRRVVPGMVRPLPIPSAFTQVREALPELAEKHYFVAISSIEPRKNFGLLLRVWSRLLEKMGENTPHLVIVGAPSLNATHILAPLVEVQGLRRRVHAVSGLSSPSLARLVAGCAALLSPSLAEGFGLPLLEGIAMGVPTIASDITAHREIAHATTTLLPPDNVEAWEAAILSVARRHTIDIPPVPQHMTEAAFCHDILKFVEAVPPKGKGLSKLDGAPIKLEISA